MEKENRLLKERLDEAGISYADIMPDNGDDPGDLFDPDQGARIRRFEVTDKVASDFFMMFCRGRKDVYELRYTNPKTGKTDIIRSALIAGIVSATYKREMAYGVRTVNYGHTSRSVCLRSSRICREMIHTVMM